MYSLKKLRKLQKIYWSLVVSIEKESIYNINKDLRD